MTLADVGDPVGLPAHVDFYAIPFPFLKPWAYVMEWWLQLNKNLTLSIQMKDYNTIVVLLH